MKTFLTCVLCAVIVAGVLAFAGLRLMQPRASASPAGGWSRMDERLERLEQGLQRLADLERQVARLADRGAAVKQPAADGAPLALPVAENGPAEPAAGGSAAAGSQTKLERWLETNGMREEMEGFIAGVYEQARNARLNREREEANARQREMEELSEGPYGKHNYRVNLLTRRLDLDGRQTQFLFNLLSQYDERVSALRREREQEFVNADGSKPSPEQLDQHLQRLAQSRKSLADGLESDFLSGLSREQQEAYNELPPEDHVGGGGGDRMVFFKQAIEVMGAGAGVAAPVRWKFEAPAPPAPAPTPGR